MSRITDNQKDRNSFLRVKTCALDIVRARDYFAGLRSLLDEAQQTNDPRVQLVALRVLKMQPASVQDLMRQA